jgi:ATP-dependent DNA helicase RecG
VSSLVLESPIAQIDARVANRRLGQRTKGPPAWEVLADGLGIHTVADLLGHFPRRYIDRSATVPIRELRAGQAVTVIARIKRVTKRLTRRRQSMVTLTLYDGTGYLDLMFFNQPWAASTYKEGIEVAASGRVEMYRGRTQLANQEVEILRDEEAETVHTGRIIPIHRATEGVTARTIRDLVYRALQQIPSIPDWLPQDVVEGEELGPEDPALREIHFPGSADSLATAVRRLKFDELFALELGVAYRKHRVERNAVGVVHVTDDGLSQRFLDALPFEPTSAQRRAVKEIEDDMAAPRPMNRLLQGDVGSGKTIVALYAALVAIQSGHQAAIMAPTEVLAGQHLRTIGALLGPIGGRDFLASQPPTADARGQQSLLEAQGGDPVDPGSATSVGFAGLSASVTGKDRALVIEGVAEGTVDLIVGTHALVQEGIEFKDLSVAVVDEQHRFGVHQRVTLKEKGPHPDVLIMTATPIPRTLALTYYGDLDVSTLDEMPAGRKPVTTQVARTAAERTAAYRLIRDHVEAGRQAFVVCAAIDESNRLEVRAAEKEAERLQREVFPELRIALLHGRMRPAEKDSVMEDFRVRKADLLIATTVVEVGVDVPNATVMLVENAERFGLAQLHQLRGRIGRGEHASVCILFDEGGPDNEDAKARLAAMERTTDGFELADEDLRLRGEGTLFDIKQSGLPDLRLAKLSEDVELVKRARRRAFELIEEDPELDAHPNLLELLRRTFSGDAIEWLFHS